MKTYFCGLYDVTLAARFTFWHKISFNFELDSSLFVYPRGEKQYFTDSLCSFIKYCFPPVIVSQTVSGFFSNSIGTTILG